MIKIYLNQNSIRFIGEMIMDKIACHEQVAAIDME